MKTFKEFLNEGIVVNEMSKSDIQYAQVNKKIVELTHGCKTELGIEDDEDFTILEIIKDFQQLVIVNQYGMEYTINPNQIKK